MAKGMAINKISNGFSMILFPWKANNKTKVVSNAIIDTGFNFGKNLFIVEVIRHPLFMVIQQALNMERLLFNERDMQVKIEYANKDLPYYAFGWEEIFLKSNFVEKAILYIKYQTLLTEQKKKELNGKINHILIPFEMFVKDPNPFILQIHLIRIIHHIIFNY